LAPPPALPAPGPGGAGAPPVPLTAAKQMHDNILNWFLGLPVIGPVLGVGAVVGLIISDLGAVSSAVSKIDNASWSFSKLIQKFADFRKSVSNKINHIELSLDDAFGNLRYLFEEIKGQEKAKEQIKSIVYGILHRKNQAKLVDKKYDRGDVLLFYGPSGVGKTLIAKGLAEYKILTSNAEPFYISASEVDKDSKETVIEQLFGGGSYAYGGYDDYNGSNKVSSAPKSLVKYLNSNPDGVVIIDEYDKMWSPALDEIFRTIMDHGVVSIKGQMIDCSGITFILTSNESAKSIQGGNQDDQTPEEVDDGTGSRTTNKHDKSFLNRLQPVEFSNLSSKEYALIIQKDFKDDLVGYWANPEVNGIDIVIDDVCLANMAKVVENKNIGARYITKLQSDLFRDISMKVFDAEVKEKDFYRGKKILVSFNPATEEFTLRGEEGKTVPETQTPAVLPAGTEVK
jgi:ATP-dependent Clp protease ATP-binding subunit ClpA